MKNFILFIFILYLFIISFYTFSQEALSFDAGLMFLGNTDENETFNAIITGLGVSIFIPIGNFGFYYLPRISVYGAYYLYNGERPVPTNIETSEFYVLDSIIDNIFGIRFRINKMIEIGVGAGISILMRVPVSLTSSQQKDFGSYLEYFYGMARFIYPDTEIFFKYNFTQNTGISVTIKALYPIFHLWDGEGLAFLDQLCLSGLVGFCFIF